MKYGILAIFKSIIQWHSYPFPLSYYHCYKIHSPMSLRDSIPVTTAKGQLQQPQPDNSDLMRTHSAEVCGEVQGMWEGHREHLLYLCVVLKE